MDRTSKVLASAVEGRNQAGIDLESIDEDVVVSDRASAVAPYRGIAPSLFFVAAAAFALVCAVIGSGLGVALMALEVGRANERTRVLEEAVASKAEAFAQCNLARIGAEAEVRTYSALLDRVAPGRLIK